MTLKQAAERVFNHIDPTDTDLDNYLSDLAGQLKEIGFETGRKFDRLERMFTGESSKLWLLGNTSNPGFGGSSLLEISFRHNDGVAQIRADQGRGFHSEKYNISAESNSFHNPTFWSWKDKDEFEAFVVNWVRNFATPETAHNLRTGRQPYMAGAAKGTPAIGWDGG